MLLKNRGTMLGGAHKALNDKLFCLAADGNGGQRFRLREE